MSIRVQVWGLSCPGFPEEVSRARRWTRDILRGSPLADDAALIVSELSTNAIRHTASGLACGSFHLAVATRPEWWRSRSRTTAIRARPRRPNTGTRTRKAAGGWTWSTPSPTGCSSTAAPRAARSPRSCTRTLDWERAHAETGLLV
ncbi:protein of unknown function [Streptomyces murinus]